MSNTCANLSCGHPRDEHYSSDHGPSYCTKINCMCTQYMEEKRVQQKPPSTHKAVRTTLSDFSILSNCYCCGRRGCNLIVCPTFTKILKSQKATEDAERRW